MKFTNEQKLIAAMLAEIHQALDIEDGIDSTLVAKALWSDNEWAIEWEHGFLLDSEETPPHVKHVVDVLDMWTFIEDGYAALDESDKKRVAEAYPYGQPRFPGFDGNNEGRYLSAARFLIEELRRFSNFANRGDLNSHSHTVEISQRMLEVFLPIRSEMGMRHGGLTAYELISIFKARVHPSRRDQPIP